MSHVGFVHATRMNTSCHTHQYTRFWAWWSNQISKKAIRQSPTRILGKHSNMANPSLVSSVMLQCVAVSCSELHGSVLQRVAACCSVLRIHHWSPLSFLCKLSPWISRDCCDCCTCQCYTSQQFARQIWPIQHDLQSTAKWNTATHGDCNTRQNSAKHCKTLQNTAKHCKALQHISSHSITLHQTSQFSHCKALQNTSTHRNTLHRTDAIYLMQSIAGRTLQRTTWHCQILQRTVQLHNTSHQIASHCITLQHATTHIAPHCITLQHATTHIVSHCITLQHATTHIFSLHYNP